jgi:hypothetical protein
VVKSIYSSIVIKVGTNVLTTADGLLLNASIVRALVHQITALMKRGTRVVLVTSGAMGDAVRARRRGLVPSRRPPLHGARGTSRTGRRCAGLVRSSMPCTLIEGRCDPDRFLS